MALLSDPSINRGQIHLRGRILQSRRTQALRRPERSMMVWHVVTCGVSVHAGALHLPEGSVLLLSGHGAHFHDCSFRGAVHQPVPRSAEIVQGVIPRYLRIWRGLSL